MLNEDIIIEAIHKLSPNSATGLDCVSSSLRANLVLERIIRKQVFSFLDQNGCLNSTQHKFRPGRSCLSVSALLDVFDNIMHMLDSNSSVDMVYLDFSKAFIRWTMASFCISSIIAWTTGNAHMVVTTCMTWRPIRCS